MAGSINKCGPPARGRWAVLLALLTACGGTWNKSNDSDPASDRAEEPGSGGDADDRWPPSSDNGDPALADPSSSDARIATVRSGVAAIRTNDSGRVYFEAESLSKDVHVYVTDEQGRPLDGIDVRLVELDGRLLLHVVDPQKRYGPAVLGGSIDGLGAFGTRLDPLVADGAETSRQPLVFTLAAAALAIHIALKVYDVVQIAVGVVEIGEFLFDHVEDFDFRESTYCMTAADAAELMLEFTEVTLAVVSLATPIPGSAAKKGIQIALGEVAKEGVVAGVLWLAEQAVGSHVDDESLFLVRVNHVPLMLGAAGWAYALEVDFDASACADAGRHQCENSSACGAGEFCAGGACTPVPERASCASSRDCPGDELCHDGGCQDFGQQGDVRVTLTWDSAPQVDLDLHLIDPDGFRISYADRNAPSGGQLDRDNLCGDDELGGPENIFWERGEAPSGEFQVMVDHFENCEVGSAGEVRYAVRVAVDGRITAQDGRIGPGQDFSVATFNR